MIHKEIKLIGQYIDYDTSNKDWWSEYQKGEALELQIKKKNALPLKEVYKKMLKDGIHYLALHFEGGHDEGGFDGNFIFYNKDKEIMNIKDISKYTPDGWITTYHPLSYTSKVKGQNIIQVFELPETDHSNFKIDFNWLEQKWYDFGFLEQWVLLLLKVMFMEMLLYLQKTDLIKLKQMKHKKVMKINHLMEKCFRRIYEN